MPSYIAGPIKITNVSSDATVNFGDTLQIAPKVHLNRSQVPAAEIQEIFTNEHVHQLYKYNRSRHRR